MNGYCSKSIKSTNRTAQPRKNNSKRKTLNGCCQICIKTVKMSQKREKPQGGASMEAWRTKMEVFEERLKMMERLASLMQT